MWSCTLLLPQSKCASSSMTIPSHFKSCLRITRSSSCFDSLSQLPCHLSICSLVTLLWKFILHPQPSVRNLLIVVVSAVSKSLLSMCTVSSSSRVCKSLVVTGSEKRALNALYITDANGCNRAYKQFLFYSTVA